MNGKIIYLLIALFIVCGLTWIVMSSAKDVQEVPSDVEVTATNTPQVDVAEEETAATPIGDPLTISTGEMILGAWQSTEDPDSVRRFESGGELIEIYAGEEVSRDRYSLFTTSNPAPVDFELEEEVVYVYVVSSTDASTTLQFAVEELSEESLVLLYMNNGGVLEYTRLEE